MGTEEKYNGFKVAVERGHYRLQQSEYFHFKNWADQIQAKSFWQRLKTWWGERPW